MIKIIRFFVAFIAVATLSWSSIQPLDAQTSRRAPNRPVYDFLAPPSQETNRIYRVNIFTGEMGVCWYSQKNNGDFTECLPPGPGAEAQKERGLFTLVATNMKTERGVFRLNLATGTVSMCWVKGDVLTCTQQAK